VNIEALQEQLRTFASERDWEQFHSPKNLAMALSVEASELLEVFQWQTESQSRGVMHTSEGEHVREEVADVMIYLLRLADTLDIDLDQAVTAKLAQNAARYDTGACKGSATKARGR
jgi:dCTP diphosphatase